MENCLFCKMVRGEIKPSLLYEDVQILAFHDINPQAPVHILIVPKEHIPTLNDLENRHSDLMGAMYLTAKKIAEQEKIALTGYRTVMNCNAAAGQSVFHIHLHILGGRQLSWPPG